MDGTNTTNGSAYTFALIFGILSLLFGLALGMAWCETIGFTNIFGKDYAMETIQMGYSNYHYDDYDGYYYNGSFSQFGFGGFSQLFLLIAGVMFLIGAYKIKRNKYGLVRKAYFVMIVALILYMLTTYCMVRADELPIFDQVFFTLNIPEIRGDNVLYCFFFELFLPLILIIMAAYNASKLKHVQVQASPMSTDVAPVITHSAGPQSPVQAPVQAEDSGSIRSHESSVTVAAIAASSNVIPKFLSNDDGKRLQIRKLKIDGGNYVGEVIKNTEGKTVAHGIGVWGNKKEYYEGCWFNGLRHGTGTVWFDGGTRICCEWNNGVMNGWASYDYKDGYDVGPMVNGNKHGVWLDDKDVETYWNFGKRVPRFEDIENIVDEKSLNSEEPTDIASNVSSSDNVLAGLIPGMEFASVNSDVSTEDEEEEFDINSIRSDDSGQSSTVNLDDDNDVEFDPCLSRSDASSQAVGHGLDVESSNDKTTMTQASIDDNKSEIRVEVENPLHVPVQEVSNEDTVAPEQLNNSSKSEELNLETENVISSSFCSNCKFKLDGQFLFCPNCGNKIR